MQCVIFGSRPVGPWARAYIPQNAFVIAADAGWQQAEKLGLVPDSILGDFDTAPPPQNGAVRITPAEKDDTDTMLAIRTALEEGAREVTLLGCLGGRPDHTLANMQALQYLAARGVQNLLVDETTEIRCVPPGELHIARQPHRYLSVFAVGGDALGVDLLGLKYPLDKAHLQPEFPLGISNEFVAKEAIVRHTAGFLLVMTTDMDRP